MADYWIRWRTPPREGENLINVLEHPTKFPRAVAPDGSFVACLDLPDKIDASHVGSFVKEFLEQSFDGRRAVFVSARPVDEEWRDKQLDSVWHRYVQMMTDIGRPVYDYAIVGTLQNGSGFVALAKAYPVM